MSKHKDHLRCGPARAIAARTASARVLVVEDHALLAAGLRLALSGRRWEVETSSVRAPAEMVKLVRRLQPQCVLLSVRLGGGVRSGLALIESLASTGAPVLLLTAERRRTVLAQFLEAGAAGWIGNDTALEDVDATLHRLVEGKTIIGKTIRLSLLHDLELERKRGGRARSIFDELTQREALVLAAMTDGLTADEIAREHVVALCTVRSQIRAVLQKLDVRSQLAAVAIASAHRELLPHRGEAPLERRQPEPREPEVNPDLSAGIA